MLTKLWRRQLLIGKVSMIIKANDWCTYGYNVERIFLMVKGYRINHCEDGYDRASSDEGYYGTHIERPDHGMRMKAIKVKVEYYFIEQLY